MPTALQATVDPKLLATTANLKANNPRPSSLLGYLQQTGQIKTPGVDPVIKPIQSVMKPMSQELPVQTKTVAPLKPGQMVRPDQPLIAGTLPTQQPQSKLITRDKLKAVLEKIPEAERAGAVDMIVAKGGIIEGYNDPQSQITQAPQKINPQFKMGVTPFGGKVKSSIKKGFSDFGSNLVESATERNQQIGENWKRLSGKGIGEGATFMAGLAKEGAGFVQDIVGGVVGGGIKSGVNLYKSLEPETKKALTEGTKKVLMTNPATAPLVQALSNDKVQELISQKIVDPTVKVGLELMQRGGEEYAKFEQNNPDAAIWVGAIANVGMTYLDLVGAGETAKSASRIAQTGYKATVEAGEQAIKRIPGVAQDFVQGAKNVKNIPGKIGDLGESAIEYGAKKLTNTVDDQGKLFKAQSPRMGQLNKKVDFENLRKNSDIANEEIVKAGFKPTDTASRADAHYKTMQKIWNDEVKAKIGDKSDIDLNPVADTIEKFAREADAGGIIKNKSQVQELLDQATEFRKLGKVDGARGEFIKEMMNAKINNWGDSTIGDIYKNGLKQGTRELGKILDDTFSAIPGQFSEAKRRFGSLKATFEDVVKADIKAQRAKGLGIEETFSRIEGVGDLASGLFGVITGRKNFQDIASGIAKIAVGKTLKKIKDPDFLIREGFEGLSKKVKKVDNLDIQKMGNRQPLPYKPSQATPVSPKGQVMMDNPQSPVPKKSPTIVIEKGVAKQPGTTKVNPKAIVRKQAETPVKTTPKKTETKIEPKKATVDQELQKVAKKVKEKSIAKKENGSIMDGMKEIIKTKSFKTDEGKFSVRDTESNPRGRTDMFTVYEDKGGYIVRNAFVPKEMQNKGIATNFYKKINDISLEKTGKPLRSTRERTLNNGEKVIELSSDGVRLWDGLVDKGLAKKIGDKNYEMLDPNKVKLSPKSDTINPKAKANK